MGCAPPPNGGSPFIPYFQNQVPTRGVADQRYVSEPAFRPTNAPAWQPQFVQEQAAAPRPVARTPLIRLKGPDEDEPAPSPSAAAAAAPTRLRLPSPGELGLASELETPHRASVDWADVHGRLDRLGALSFHQQKTTEGGYRVTFLLPTAQPDRTHEVDAHAETAAEAVRLALGHAEKWVAGK
jgi:hypothetical protein